MSDRLTAGRRRGFVGREAEQGLFSALLRSDELPVVVLFVHGPAGVGKSTLLRRFAELCQDAGTPCLSVDARDLPPVGDALARMLAPLLPGPAEEELPRSVVLLDTYELVEQLDRWLREELLPQLPADTLVVIAGQNPPAPAWRTDAGWAGLVRTVRLANLNPQESQAYLEGQGVEASLREDAVTFTHGHPLALALVGEVLRDHEGIPPDRSADVIKTLLDRLLRGVPSAAHRHALEACAQVRVTSEPLLAALLGSADVAELFDWLRHRPFVDLGPNGLYPHDLARDVLAADLRWRDAERFVELHARARRHYLTRLEGADAGAQSRLLLDLMYLHEDLRPFLRPPEASGGVRVEPARPEDAETLCSMVAAHEGGESARLAGHWLARQPTAWQVVRDAGGEAAGLTCLLAVQDVPPADREADPAVVAAWRQLDRMPPLRPGERATLVRFWMARDTYQAVSPVQSLIAVQLARHYLTTPALAVTLLPFAEPDSWAEFCAYADQSRMPGADFVVDGRPYGVYGHDWRVVTPAAWVALLSQRETGDGTATAPASEPARRLLVLGEEDFKTAVRRALRDLNRPDRLRDNPLLGTRLVRSQVNDDATEQECVTTLQAAVRDAVASLRETPADERLYRVLHRAYLSPAASLERAAEVLDLPSSTFRRHLSAAVGRVTETLWQRELGM